MKLDFQKQIATSQMTLPVMSVLMLALWFVLPSRSADIDYLSADYGLWSVLPHFSKGSFWDLSLSACIGALSIYFLAELNNANMLLRIGSRMLASMLASMLVITVSLRHFQPGSFLLLFSLLSYFPLFSTYQNPNPVSAYSAYSLLSLASLVFPKLLWLVPVYWMLQIILRAFTLRCFVASLLAVVQPYLFYGAVALLTGGIPRFMQHLTAVYTFRWFDYASFTPVEVTVFSFLVLLFVSGSIDFFINRFKEKTRVRFLYNVLIIHGVAIILFILLQPHLFETILPLLLIDTAILFGHFFALTYTRFSHIYCLVLLLLAVAVVVVQYVPQLLSMW